MKKFIYLSVFLTSLTFANDVQTLDKECSQNKFESCLTLGSYYAEGINGVSKDMDKAETYFEKSCEHDILDGCLLSISYLINHEMKEKDKLLNFTKKACDLKDARSCHQYAVYHYRGEIVEKNMDIAKEYMKKAKELDPDLL